MNEEEYIEQRVEDQILWYDKKSKNNQKLYKWIKFIEIFLSALLAFLAVVLPENLIKYVSVFIGFILVILAGIASLNKLQENWIQYRTTAEVLKQEKYLYLTKSGPYSEGKKFELFVERIENTISKEEFNLVTICDKRTHTRRKPWLRRKFSLVMITITIVIIRICSWRGTKTLILISDSTISQRMFQLIQQMQLQLKEQFLQRLMMPHIFYVLSEGKPQKAVGLDGK